MKNQNSMPEIEQMFGLATDFFKAADEFCKKQKGLCTPHSEPMWHSVEDEEKPLDCELVLVQSNKGSNYLQTYMRPYGFTKEVAYWMHIPEIDC